MNEIIQREIIELLVKVANDDSNTYAERAKELLNKLGYFRNDQFTEETRKQA